LTEIQVGSEETWMWGFPYIRDFFTGDNNLCVAIVARQVLAGLSEGEMVADGGRQ
jgi:hypothetical protein